jgi:hypothetical protein
LFLVQPQALEVRMERLTNPASLAALQDFQGRMNGLRDATLLEPSLRFAIEKFTVKQWEEIAADLRHTVSTLLLLLLLRRRRLRRLRLTTRHVDGCQLNAGTAPWRSTRLPQKHGCCTVCCAIQQKGGNGGEQQQQQGAGEAKELDPEMLRLADCAAARLSALCQLGCMYLCVVCCKPRKQHNPFPHFLSFQFHTRCGARTQPGVFGCVVSALLLPLQGWTAAEAQRHWECSCSLTALAGWEEDELMRLR